MKANTEQERIERRISELGNHYWQRMQGEVPSLFNRQYWQGQILDWVMNDENFKVDAFRFIDVLPALARTSAISTHVRDYLLAADRNLPVVVRSALAMAAGGIASPLATRAIRANVTEMARRFICESEPKKALAILEKLGEENLTFTADILGEATTSDAESDIYITKYLDLIDLLAGAAENWPANHQIHSCLSGTLPKVNISVKLSSFDPYIDPADQENSVARLRERLLPLLRHAKKREVFVNFDMEQWAYHDINYALFEEMAFHPDLVDWPHLGVVVQTYLKESDNDVSRLLDVSARRGTPFTVRLVKGAYWDYEVVHARQHGFTCPVFTNKARTDASFEHLSRRLIENHVLVSPAFASHNLRSLVHAIAVLEEEAITRNCIEIQTLFGMAEPMRRILAREGFRVRVYAPIGDLLPGMAYLVRRLLENTANSSFLRQSYHEGVSISTMLAPPLPGPPLPEPPLFSPGDPASPFVNVNLLDFTDSTVREEFARAVGNCAGRFPLQVPVVVAGEEIADRGQKERRSPNDPALIVARVSQADADLAERAVEIAGRAFPAWRDTSVSERAALLERLGALLEKDRMGFAALQTHEEAKPWREADGDVAEAIDFCRYYARRAIQELAPAGQGSVAGEDNVLFYEGRGPTVVIAPWNFPLAILCGMSSAALVSGNTVIIKPAAAAAAVAHRFYRHLLAAGFSPEVVQFLPGPGELVGNYLVEHPRICQIAFTGSREVGLGIIEKAGRTRPGQAEVKRVVCEMGGKNGIIVDEDADPDAALKGVMASAFGYAGQKCSACSRLILVGSIHRTFMPRLLEACRSLPMAAATDPACRLGPVIDQAAHERLGRLINEPPEGAKLLFLGETPSPGYFIPPAIFEVRDRHNPMLQEEFFGPLLTVIRAADFEEALDIANSTDYALTGAVFSRSPRNIETARRGFKVGNLYINRGSTGAIVSRQPFGGFGMSGGGTKAGGPGYLLHYANPRCITENTMRSGFTPDLQM